MLHVGHGAGAPLMCRCSRDRPPSCRLSQPQAGNSAALRRPHCAFLCRRPARNAALRLAAAASGSGSRGSSTAAKGFAPANPGAAHKAEDAAATKAFVSWAREAGIEFPKLTVAYFDGVRGMAARAAIVPGDALVQLPRDSALLATPGQRCPFPTWVDATFWDAKPWSVRLALMLLHEARQGASSRVAGYVAQLPRSFDTPLHWSAMERQALAYPHLVAEVEQQERQWKQLYTDLMAASPQCGVSREELTWAMECVLSRAFSGPYSGSTLRQKGIVAGVLFVIGAGSVAAGAASLESVLNAGIAAVLFNIIYDSLLGAKLKWHALVPVIDAMNHSSNSKSEVSFEYFRDRFVAEANDPVTAGAQAFITYGRQGNDRLLQYYGFVEAKNPTDTYIIRDLSEVIEAVVGQRLRVSRQAALHTTGLAAALEKGAFNREGVEAETLAAVRAALASADPTAAEDFRKLQEPKAELLARQVLLKCLEREQQRLQAVVQPPSGRHAKLIETFRVEKATILAAALQATQLRVTALKASR